MEYAKKMVLIPEESAKRFQQLLNLPPTVQTPGTPLTRLDREMSEISASSKFKDEREKWSSYQEVLERYLRKKNPDTVVKPPDDGLGKTEAEKEKDLNVEIILQNVAKTHRDGAKQLLHFIDKTSNVTWNRDGRLVIDGTELPNSNIASLINDAARKRKNKRGRPPNGRAQLSLALQRAGVPKDLISNNEFWDAAAEISLHDSQIAVSTSSPRSASTSSPKQSPTKQITPPSRGGLTSWINWNPT